MTRLERAAQAQLDRLAAKWRTRGIHRLPVVEASGQLAGILSLTDLAREAGREQHARKRDVTCAEIGETLDAVCRPRGPRAICVIAA